MEPESTSILISWSLTCTRSCGEGYTWVSLFSSSFWHAVNCRLLPYYYPCGIPSQICFVTRIATKIAMIGMLWSQKRRISWCFLWRPVANISVLYNLNSYWLRGPWVGEQWLSTVESIFYPLGNFYGFCQSQALCNKKLFLNFRIICLHDHLTPDSLICKISRFTSCT